MREVLPGTRWLGNDRRHPPIRVLWYPPSKCEDIPLVWFVWDTKFKTDPSVHSRTLFWFGFNYHKPDMNDTATHRIYQYPDLIRLAARVKRPVAKRRK